MSSWTSSFVILNFNKAYLSFIINEMFFVSWISILLIICIFGVFTNLSKSIINSSISSGIIVGIFSIAISLTYGLNELANLNTSYIVELSLIYSLILLYTFSLSNCLYISCIFFIKSAYCIFISSFFFLNKKNFLVFSSFNFDNFFSSVRIFFNKSS